MNTVTHDRFIAEIFTVSRVKINVTKIHKSFDYTLISLKSVVIFFIR